MVPNSLFSVFALIGPGDTLKHTRLKPDDIFKIFDCFIHSMFYPLTRFWENAGAGTGGISRARVYYRFPGIGGSAFRYHFDEIQCPSALQERIS